MTPPQITPDARPSTAETVRRVWRFTLRVLRHFQRNKGFLLAGGVAYNIILSIVPLLAVFLAAASRFFDRAEVLKIITAVLDHSVPNQAGEIGLDIENFLLHPELLGGVGLVVVLFFSSLAFRMLQDAMAVIFERPQMKKKQRSFWMSAFLPYIYIAVAVSVLVAVTVLVAALGLLRSGALSLFGVALGDLSALALQLGGFVGEVLLFASIYRVMPVTHVKYRRALIGGFASAVLWELVRRLFVWWFTTLSLVSVVYGSLTSIVVLILVLEIAAMILLLGGQIIAELEHSEEAGLPWYIGAPLERTGTTGAHGVIDASIAGDEDTEEVVELHERASPGARADVTPLPRAASQGTTN
jgi:YihY family inner membrane protein